MSVDNTIFASLPFNEHDVEIVEIKCMSRNKNALQKYLKDKLGDNPKFKILPATMSCGE